MTNPTDPLLAAAFAAREHAHAPYSGFQVGAALETSGGHIFAGCNIESSSYGLTMCAERVAAFAAIAAGARNFQRMAVATAAAHLTPPCGACRQVLWDLCGDLPLTLVNAAGDSKTYRLSELFPDPFDAKSLD